MKRRNAAVYLGVLLITCAILFGVSAAKKYFSGDEGETRENEVRGDFAVKAVYLTDGEENSIFVDLATESPFYGRIPEKELYSEEEENIGEEDLNCGDVVNIWGNGIIAQSYPAQYNGITKIQRVEQKNQEYLDKYGHYMEEFFVKEDVSQVPFLDLCYTQTDAIITASVTEYGGYTWTYENEQGETVTETADSAHILHWEDITEITTEGPAEIGFQFSSEPEKVEVFRWTKEQKTEAMKNLDTAQIPEGEAVEVSEDRKGRPAVTAEPGYVYLVKGYWESGEAEYGFLTLECEKIE